jgi:hypothetical protein
MKKTRVYHFTQNAQRAVGQTKNVLNAKMKPIAPTVSGA